MLRKETLSDNLKYYRISVVGLTQVELSKKLNFSHSTVARAEKEGVASLEYIVAFAELSGIPIDTLVGLKPKCIPIDDLAPEEVMRLNNFLDDIRNHKKR